MTMLRDVASASPLTARQVHAIDLLHIAANDLQRTRQPAQDRALAHAIRAALRCGLTWRTVEATTRLDHGEAVECLDRWPGDQS